MDEEKEKSWKNGQPLEKGVLLKPTQFGIGEFLGSLLGLIPTGSKNLSTKDIKPVHADKDQQALLWLQKVEAGEIDPSAISPSDYKQYKKSLLKLYSEKELEKSFMRGRIKSGTVTGKQADFFNEMELLEQELEAAPTLEQKKSVRARMEELQKNSASS